MTKEEHLLFVCGRIDTNLIESTDGNTWIILVSDSNVCSSETVTLSIDSLTISLLTHLSYRPSRVYVPLDMLQVISLLVQNSQPSQPITWLILTKLNMNTTKENIKNLISNARKQAQTEANETKVWFTRLFTYLAGKRISSLGPRGVITHIQNTSVLNNTNSQCCCWY